MATLITPYEVVLYSPAGKEYPTDWICKLIPAIEEEYGYECLGKTLYEWLQTNVAEVPEDVEEWNCGSAYGIGEYTIRNGCLFKSTVDVNQTDPIDDEAGDWEAAKRFGDNECANNFWELHLRGVLALKVFSRSVGVTTRKAGANGLTMLEGGGSFQNQGFKSAGKNDLSDYKNDLNKELETATRNMVRWVNRTVADTTDCTVPLSSMLLCQTNLCQPSSNNRHRFSFGY